MVLPALRGVRPTFDVFIGGPMSEDDSVDSNGFPLREHLPNLISAARSVAASLNAEYRQKFPDLNYDFIKINFPPGVLPELPAVGDITQTIFSLIDEADAAIVDLSAPVFKARGRGNIVTRTSPNIIYEVAWLHALGTPTILLLPKNVMADFYFLQQAHKQVDFSDVQGLIDKLMPQIRAVLCLDGDFSTDMRREEIASNPISTFYKDGNYSVPLVDISSVVGLATGYFYNFLSKTRSEDFFQTYRAVLVIRPDRIETIETIKGRIEVDHGIKLVRDTFVVRGPSSTDDKDAQPQSRPFGIEVAVMDGKRYVVDIPTPLKAMAISKRYGVARSKLARARISEQEEVDRAMPLMDRGIIDKFFRELTKGLQLNRVRGENIHFLSIDEAVAYIKAGK